MHLRNSSQDGRDSLEVLFEIIPSGSDKVFTVKEVYFVVCERHLLCIGNRGGYMGLRPTVCKYGCCYGVYK